jgi:hypothetical protein
MMMMMMMMMMMIIIIIIIMLGIGWAELVVQRPHIGLLYQARVIRVCSVGGITDRGKPKFSEENLLQCQFVRHKSYMDRFGIKPRHPLWEVGDYTPEMCVTASHLRQLVLWFMVMCFFLIYRSWRVTPTRT